MTDALHQFRRRARRQGGQGLIANIPLADSSADFDKLMVGEGAVQFVDHAVGEAGVAEHHDGAEGMCQAAQMFLLFFR